MAKPEITMMKTDALIPYARNPRTHSDIQVGQIAASIKEFGWLVPVVVDSENVLIAGHGRVLAAQKLGLDRVPTIDGSHLTPAQAKAFRIAENKLQQNAGWDDDLLRLELEEMVADDYGIDFTGFDEGELTTLLLPVEIGETDTYKEWEGMPEYDQEDKKSFRYIIIHFDNNDDVAGFFSIIGQDHTNATRSIWYPKKKNIDHEANRYG
jgi:hypothetical protein